MADSPARTDEEQRIYEYMVERRGEEYVEENWELVLAQARSIGDL